MTAIAVKDGVIASDSLGMFGSYKLSRDVEKVYADHLGQYFVIGTGRTADINAFFEWARGGMDGQPPELKEDVEGDSSVIHVVWKSGLHDIYSTCGKSAGEQLDFVGLGAFDFLIGAMAVGASAVQAVAAACNMVRGCDFPIRVYRFGEPVEIITRAQWEAKQAGAI